MVRRLALLLLLLPTDAATDIETELERSVDSAKRADLERRIGCQTSADPSSNCQLIDNSSIEV